MPEIRLTDLMTLKDVAPRVGSYSTAYALATAGAFGEPLATIGRMQLFSRVNVETAIAAYRAKRQPRAGRGA